MIPSNWSRKSAESLVKSISVDELTCTICCSIFVEPVLLPCGHGFCLNCFEGTIKFNPLICPCCRKRFGNWLRKASLANGLVNQMLWTYIQANFPEELQKENVRPTAAGTLLGIRTSSATTRPQRIDALSTAADATTVQHYNALELGPTTKSTALTAESPKAARKVSEPGEIRKEYEKELEIFQIELQKERQNELKATSEFIVKLIEKELISNQSDSSSNETSIDGPSETMLVATHSRAPYPLNSSKANNLSTVQADSKKNNVIIDVSSLPNPSSTSSSFSGAIANASSVSAKPGFLAQTEKCNLIKTLAVRLNRDTDVLKQTVHKALISKTQSYLAGAIKREVLTIPPTSTHRSPNRNLNSADSLRLETCHFKPIRTVPTTPSKKNNEIVLRTPKAKRIARLKVEGSPKRASDMKPSSLQEKLLQRPRKSAFCVILSGASSQNKSNVIKSRKSCTALFRTSDSGANLIIDISTDPARNAKHPVVLLKRLDATIVLDTAENDLPKSRNGGWKAPCKNGLLKAVSVQNKPYENKISTKTSILDPLGKLIIEQKRCEEIIEQERTDFELAKKLQAELNVEQVMGATRTNTRKRRNQGSGGLDRQASANSEIRDRELEPVPVPLTKRCRRTCGRILTFNETEIANHVDDLRSDCQKAPTVNSLRRSTRQSKPTRRYIN